MTQEEKINHLESKVDKLERVVDFLKERMGLSDKEELNAIIDDIISCKKSKAQNIEAINEFLKRGGRLS